jgi:SpoVK/Ycf46/Vps4 family AAA+-type ATPase
VAKSSRFDPREMQKIALTTRPQGMNTLVDASRVPQNTIQNDFNRMYEQYVSKMNTVPVNQWKPVFYDSYGYTDVNPFKEGDVVTPKTSKSTKAKPGDKLTVVNSNNNQTTLRDKNGQVFTLSCNSLEKWTKPPKAKVTFESVIIAEEKKALIMDALEQINHHDLIFDQWGFEDVFEKGTAISMLFYGVPGTGKTLMAQAIADKLDKKLRILGTADIESSEPGAAERNIKQIFEKAKDDTILLFDECDSLIYDRTNVGAILAAQVNQLLTSLENFKGIVIFTTNQLGVLDEAFNRRLSLKLEFELPDFTERIAIWKRMFPERAPVAKDMDWERLARVEIAGGFIKNTVIRAVRMTAARGFEEINTDIMVSALREEVKAMNKFEQSKINSSSYGLSRGGGQIMKGIA